jgi:predicted nucleic acid-binding protein
LSFSALWAHFKATFSEGGFFTYNEIHFIDEEQIPKDKLIDAINLVNDIDRKDIVFIALTEFLDSKLWTGDKKLIQGLKAKGYDKVLSTDEMVELRFNIDNQNT